MFSAVLSFFLGFFTDSKHVELEFTDDEEEVWKPRQNWTEHHLVKWLTSQYFTYFQRDIYGCPIFKNGFSRCQVKVVKPNLQNKLTLSVKHFVPEIEGLQKYLPEK